MPSYEKEKRVDLDCVALAPEHYEEKDWWLPVGAHSSFFFHCDRAGESYSVRNQNTYQTSSYLAELIRSLRYYRVKTTPVCEGSVYTAIRVKEAFTNLKRVEQNIQGEGQEFMNIATLESKKVVNPHWNIPWSNWVDMEEDLNQYAGIGKIGVLAEEEWIHQWCENLSRMQNITVNRKGNEYKIWVIHKSSAARRSAWEVALSSFKLFAPINL
jgi:hypothetical protein